jgi:hypothetical protein
MPLSRRFVVVLAVVLVALGLLLVAPSLLLTAPVDESTYGYGVSLDTNATLENVTLLVPLPGTANGSGPIVDAVRAGAADAPPGWEYDVVETERGLALRLRSDEVPSERRPDGRRYSTYQFGVTVPAGQIIDTATPYGEEPTLASVGGRRPRPCPNQVGEASRESCFDFDSWVYLSYDAPPDADVGLVLVNNGVNTYRGPGHAMYYERLQLAFDGPQEGWQTVDGFANTESGPQRGVEDSRSSVDGLAGDPALLLGGLQSSLPDAADRFTRRWRVADVFHRLWCLGTHRVTAYHRAVS